MTCIELNPSQTRRLALKLAHEIRESVSHLPGGGPFGEGFTADVGPETAILADYAYVLRIVGGNIGSALEAGAPAVGIRFVDIDGAPSLARGAHGSCITFGFKAHPHLLCTIQSAL